jgi:hypothetical protein
MMFNSCSQSHSRKGYNCEKVQTLTQLLSSWHKGVCPVDNVNHAQLHEFLLFKSKVYADLI